LILFVFKKLVVVINEETLDFQEVANVEIESYYWKGFKIISFNKEEILRNIDGVLDAITQELDESEASAIKKVEVFTRPDTIFGVLWLLLQNTNW
jgi:very-short-patch-repair endonuclease